MATVKKITKPVDGTSYDILVGYAEKDAKGNVIADTYATKEEAINAQTAAENAQTDIDTLSSKAELKDTFRAPNIKLTNISVVITSPTACTINFTFLIEYSALADGETYWLDLCKMRNKKKKGVAKRTRKLGRIDTLVFTKDGLTYNGYGGYTDANGTVWKSFTWSMEFTNYDDVDSMFSYRGASDNFGKFNVRYFRVARSTKASRPLSSYTPMNVGSATDMYYAYSNVEKFLFTGNKSGVTAIAPTLSMFTILS